MILSSTEFLKHKGPLIGRGAFAEVYRTKMNGKHFALKILKPPKNIQPSAILESLSFEYWVLKNIEHPNIVEVYANGVTDAGEIYLLEELLDGPALRDFCQNKNFSACAPVLIGVLEALEALHEWKLIHGDIKSDNIIVITKQGASRPKLLDFGLSRPFEHENDKQPQKQNELCGTPSTLPPEIIRGEKRDARSDIYSWAATVYECLIGKSPFHASTFEATLHAQLNVTPAPLALHRNDVPPLWSELIDRCLAKNPDDRPLSAKQILTALKCGVSVKHEHPKTDASLPQNSSENFEQQILLLREKLLKRQLRMEDSIWKNLEQAIERSGSRDEKLRRQALLRYYRGGALIDQGEFENARENIAAALAVLSEDPCHAVEKIRAQNYLAYIQMRQGRIQEAIATYEKSASDRDHLAAAERRLITNLDLGSAYLQAGRLEDASRELNKRLDEHRADNNATAELSALYQLGLIASKSNDWNTAQERFEEASRLAKKLKDPVYLLRALNGLGNAISRTSEFVNAVSVYDRVSDLAIALKDHGSASAALQNRALLHLKLKHLKEADSDFESSLHLAERIQPRYAFEKNLVARALAELGNIALERRQYELAQNRLDRAWHFAQGDPDVAIQRFEILKSRCELWKRLEDHVRLKTELARLNHEAGNDSEKIGIVKAYRGELSENVPLPSLHEIRLEDELKKILAVNRELIFESDRDRLLKKILEFAVEITRAELGVILLQDTKGELFPVSSLNANLDGDLHEISLSVAKRVLTSGEPVRATDAINDADFSAYASVMNLQLKSIMGLPIRFKGETLGVLYLSHRHRAGLFDDRNLSIAKAFADQAGLALKTHELLDFHRRVNAELKDEIDDLNVKLVQAESQQADESNFTFDTGDGKFMTRSSKLKSLAKTAKKIAETSLAVVLHGESGTGKEVLARFIHHASTRRNKPFIAVNCGALPTSLAESELFGHVRGAFTGADRERIGLIEAAHQGSLFLDEIADLSLDLQAKLLRALQEKEIKRVGETRSRPVEFRVIAASHKSLKEMVARGKFREDLYYRLAGTELTLPPLRERTEDIPLLAESFLKSFRQSNQLKHPEKIAPSLMKKMLSYSWPGNIRELKNVIEAAVALCEGKIITAAHLPDFIESRFRGPQKKSRDAWIGETAGWYDPRLTWKEHESLIYASALTAFDFDTAQTAASLKVGIATVYKKMREQGIREQSHLWRNRVKPYTKGLALATLRDTVFRSAAQRHKGHPYRAAKELDVAPMTFYRYVK